MVTEYIFTRFDAIIDVGVDFIISRQVYETFVLRPLTNRHSWPFVTAVVAFMFNLRRLVGDCPSRLTYASATLWDSSVNYALISTGPNLSFSLPLLQTII